MSGKQLSYEDIKSELDGIVEDLGKGDIDLDQTVDKYKRGLELIQELQKRLADAKNTVTKLHLEQSDE